MKHFLHKHSGNILQAVALLMAVCILTINTAIVYATSAQDKLDEAEEGLSEAQDQIDDIKDDQEEINSEIADAETKLDSILSQLEQLKQDIDDKEDEIEQTEIELAEAEATEEEQYESMKLRIQYMYENNTADSIWTAILEANGFVDMLNRLEYIAQVNQADRDMLDEYEAAVEAVTEKKTQLETERDELLYQQEVYLGQQSEVEELIEELGDKADAYAQKLKAAQQLAAEYQETIDEQNAIIEEQARKAQEEAEAEAARKAAEEAAAAEAAAASERAASEKAASEKAASEAAAAEAAAANSSDDSDDDNSSSDSSSDSSSSDSSSSDSDDSSSDSSSSDSDSSSSSSSGVSGQDIVNYALQFVGNPYVWGGNSLTSGCDCSGFVHQVLAHFGISSPRYSQSFALYGKAVARSDIQAGDIVVYSGHVAIYIGNGKIVEAQSTRAGITSNRSVDCSTILAIRRYV